MIYNNPKIYQSSFEFDDLFKDLKSDSYLKNFSQKRQNETMQNNDNQIRSNYQYTFQSQKNEEIYYSNIYSIQQNNNLQQQQQYSSPQSSYEDQYYLKQNSPPKNFYNVQASSYVPTFHQSNSPPRSNSPNNLTQQQQNFTSTNSYPRSPSPNSFPRSHSPPQYQFNYPLSYERMSNQNNFNPSFSFDENQFNFTPSGYSQIQSSNFTKNNNVFPEEVEEITIEVWEENMEQELRRLVNLSEKYSVIGYDCEFPGVIYQPKEFDYKDTSLSYPYLKSNVDNLQVIQIGLSLSDENGNLPVLSNKKIVSWQFNFKFDLKKQPHNIKSIELLKNAGIDFDLLQKKGIDHLKFGKLLLKSGLVMNENMKWITFHSMFDYGYLIKLLINEPLPNNESQFFNLFHTFFPVSFDIKYFFHHHTSIKVGGLESISKSFKLERKGIAHQAGSDSFLTITLFFEILRTYRNQWIDQNFQSNLNGSIFGLNFSRIGTKVF